MISPKTCNLNDGLERPTPTLPANSAMAIVASAFALINGIPEISLTEKIHPVFKTGVIENNWPCAPSKESELSSSTFKNIGLPVCPINAIEGMVVIPVVPICAWLNTNLPLIPTPPLTTSAPVFTDVDAVEELTTNWPALGL